MLCCDGVVGWIVGCEGMSACLSVCVCVCASGWLYDGVDGWMMMDG